jgi:hypothetical protein
MRAAGKRLALEHELQSTIITEEDAVWLPGVKVAHGRTPRNIPERGYSCASEPLPVDRIRDG